MQNRSQIIQDFFDLVIYLNRGNTKANTKTELVFDIRSNAEFLDFGCYLKVIKSPHFLILCRKKADKRWASSGFTRFIHLEDYCRNQLNLNEGQKNRELLLKIVITNLRSFGVF